MSAPTYTTIYLNDEEIVTSDGRILDVNGVIELEVIRETGTNHITESEWVEAPVFRNEEGQILHPTVELRELAWEKVLEKFSNQ